MTFLYFQVSRIVNNPVWSGSVPTCDTVFRLTESQSWVTCAKHCLSRYDWSVQTVRILNNSVLYITGLNSRIILVRLPKIKEFIYFRKVRKKVFSRWTSLGTSPLFLHEWQHSQCTHPKLYSNNSPPRRKIMQFSFHMFINIFGVKSAKTTKNLLLQIECPYIKI